MDEFSFENLKLLDEIYQNYKQDPEAVELSWRYFLEGWELRDGFCSERGSSDDLKVYYLIEAYRTYGHLKAKINPLKLQEKKEVPELELKNYELGEEDLGKKVPTCGFLKEKEAELRVIVEGLGKTYCSSIGIEYMGMRSHLLEKWIQHKIEPYFPLVFSKEEKLDILNHLNRAEIFETFLHTKYVGQKRFSLEGGETLIPMLEMIIEAGSQEGVQEVVMGMAHRGRLNVLTNILNKSYEDVFHEFEDHLTKEEEESSGDVKYHKGFTGSLMTKKGIEVKVTLVANPSHLEMVAPVVEGQTRAKQELKNSLAVIPIVIHGDAAIAGQGVVYETLQMHKLKGYRVGGTLHIVVNNQIGFTTLPEDSRSTEYCTDIAKTFGAPVFHVNAENPEECVYAAKLALQIRQTFGCDVFLDLNCYRKYGHNEGDEPSFTQPLEYLQIRSKKQIRQLYYEKLIQEGVLSHAQVEVFEQEFKRYLQGKLDTIQKETIFSEGKKEKLGEEGVVTALDQKKLVHVAEVFCTLPQGFNLHPKIKKVVEERLAMVKKEVSLPVIDWAMGEHLAYATLLLEGNAVRLSGQDCERGTFSHRHAVWVDQQEENKKYYPLSQLGNFHVFNSSLSELAVVGFEFGYSLSTPKTLTIWEAQYGDFANGAQIIIDQFISSSEQKWGLRTNFVLMLPHGYEGQGPEHSSARIERFLQLCGNENMFVCNLSTPAQLFHALRRQMKLKRQKPLILFTPKAMLRNPLAVSALADFSSCSFEEFLDDPEASKNSQKLIFCSGKVYYDLIAHKTKECALIRIEQLYPFSVSKMEHLLKKYENFKEVVWAQEEPQNMGAWSFMRPILEELCAMKIKFAGREESASPATGSYKVHKQQLEKFIREAF